MRSVLSNTVLALGLSVSATLASAQSLYINDPAEFGTRLDIVSVCDDCYEEVSFTGVDQSFEFFGNTYSTAFVTSNGIVSFGSGYSGFSPQPLDTQEFVPMIAGLFTDLDARPVRSNIYLNDSTPGQLVITWENMSTFSQDSTNSTFQVVIRSDQFTVPAGEGKIGFFFGEIESPRDASGGFGDGLPESNPGEISLFFGPATEQSFAPSRWFNLGAGGVPVDPDNSTDSDHTIQPIPTLGEWAMIGLVALMAVFGVGRVRGSRYQS